MALPDAPDPAPPLLVPDDVAAVLLVEFTDDQATACEAMIEMVEGEAWAIIHKGLGRCPRRYSVAFGTTGGSSEFVPVDCGPIESVEGVWISTDVPTATPTTLTEVALGSYGRDLWGVIIGTVGLGNGGSVQVTIDYTGGLDGPELASIKGVCLRRVARMMSKIVDRAVGTANLQVEGYSASWMDESWTEAELKQLKSSRRIRAGWLAPANSLSFVGDDFA